MFDQLRRIVDQPVFRMHHFQPGKTVTDFAETADLYAGFQLLALLHREMKKPERQFAAAAVGDAANHAVSATLDLVGEFDAAADQGCRTGQQLIKRRDSAAVLVT